MAARLEMLKSVRFLRILAAADMATGEAYAQLIPLLSKRKAFLAAACARHYLPNFTHMFARLAH